MSECDGKTCGVFIVFSVCGKPAKGFLRDGTPACGVHLTVERRRIERENKRKEDCLKRKEFRDEVISFSKLYGLETIEPIGHVFGSSKIADERMVKIGFDELVEAVEKWRRQKNS